MNYTIAVCDDDSAQLKIIESYLKKFMEECKKEISIITSSSGEETLKKIVGKNIDIFLLDVEMKGMDGLELGKKLREINPKAIIIFITGFKDYALNAFSIRAFDYILKPISYDKFKPLLKECIQRLKEIHSISSTEKLFQLNTKDYTYNIKYSHICYFEKILRKVKVVCADNEYEFYGSFKNLMDNLDMEYFTQCHQSFIVNNNHIASYKNQQIYVEDVDKYLPVSRNFIKNVKESLGKSLFK